MHRLHKDQSMGLHDVKEGLGPRNPGPPSTFKSGKRDSPKV